MGDLLPDQMYRYRFEDAEYDEAAGKLRVADQTVSIEPRPLQLLSELLRHPGEVVTKEELLDTVWHGRITVEHVLASAVNRLRKALGPMAGARIVTVPRLGYRFDGALTRSVVGTAAPAVSGLVAGAEVPGRPSFRLIEVLDSEGRKRTWLAENKATGECRVFKFAFDADSLRSIKREYTVFRLLRAELGDMDGFVKVIDANFAEPPLFLELSYGGIDLPRWAEASAALGAMTQAQRLQLFLSLARSVASAHQVGVLHKDIKPSNVLVAGDPDPLRLVLADLGSAGSLDLEQLRRLGVTAMGMTVDVAEHRSSLTGTAAYLAPEVLAGQAASVQSDLYALGIVLYQLLVGDFTRPMASGWQAGVEDELMRADIEAATQGSPQSRLKSVGEWLQRLETLAERHAHRRETRDAEERYQRDLAELQRRRARRPWVVLAVGSLSVGLIVSSVFALKERRALLASQQATERSEAVSNFLHKDILEVPDTTTIGSDVSPGTMLDIMRKAAAKTSDRFAGQPMTEALVRRRLGETFMKMTAWEDARREIDKAVVLMTSAVSPDHEELLSLRALRSRLSTQIEREKIAKAELDEIKRLAGPDRLAIPSELSFQVLRAEVDYLKKIRAYQDAEPLARRLVSVADQALPVGGQESADSRVRLAEILYLVGKRTPAEDVVQRLEDAPFRLPDARIEFLAHMHIRLGEQLRETGDHQAALDEFQSAMKWALQATVRRGEFTVAWTELEIADSLFALGDHDAAFRRAIDAREGMRRLFGPTHQYVYLLTLRAALARLASGHQREGLDMLDEVESGTTKAWGRPGWPDYVIFARVREALDRLDGDSADRMLAEIDAGRLQAFSYEPDMIAQLAFERGRLAILRGDHGSAQSMLTASVEDMKRLGGYRWRVERAEGWIRSQAASKRAIGSAGRREDARPDQARSGQ